MKLFALIVVYFLVPPVGVAVFVLLCYMMLRAGIPSAPYVSYFILFSAFGGLLMVVLTGLLGNWSGMHSLGTVFLVLVAPIVTAVIAFKLRRRRAMSPFHLGAYIASIVYSSLMLVAFGSWLRFHDFF
jgi:hypothetical protein